MGTLKIYIKNYEGHKGSKVNLTFSIQMHIYCFMNKGGGKGSRGVYLNP